MVCPDLRGYGQSSKPPTAPDHAPYSKRAMAGDVLQLMRQLGHQRFAVVGHDRGSYVAFRLALDAPQAVTRLVVLDSVPIAEALDRADARFATAWWHWFFFAQPDLPERVILADPDVWYRGDAHRMGEDNHADFRRAVHDPATVRAMLEDYRAGLGVDRVADEADRAAGRRVACPTLVLWSTRDDLADLYGDVLAVWEPWASDLSGGSIDSGHHVAEDAPPSSRPGSVSSSRRTSADSEASTQDRSTARSCGHRLRRTGPVLAVCDLTVRWAARLVGSTGPLVFDAAPVWSHTASGRGSCGREVGQ